LDDAIDSPAKCCGVKRRVAIKLIFYRREQIEQSPWFDQAILDHVADILQVKCVATLNLGERLGVEVIV
jgi:hypothetical protein